MVEGLNFKGGIENDLLRYGGIGGKVESEWRSFMGDVEMEEECEEEFGEFRWLREDRNEYFW